MKIFSLFFIVLTCLQFIAIVFFSNTYAEGNFEDQYQYMEERVTTEGSTLIIPDDITWTQRFILSELKDLRVDLESIRRNINTEMNDRELRTVDRALAYSGNMVNFLWLILTMAVTGFGLVGWKTMKDVRNNLTENFNKEMQKRIEMQNKELEKFMQDFQEKHMSQSKKILQNQEYIKKKQEVAYYWSQYNREDNPAQKLVLLDTIESFGLEENLVFIIVERISIYTDLGVWDKALEMAEKGLEIESENSNYLTVKAEALLMLDRKDEALLVVKNIFSLYPTLSDELSENPILQSIFSEIE